MANLLIMGASKGVGLMATTFALQCGHRVTAFACGSGSIPLRHSHLQTFAGDALRQQDVVAAIDDAEAVIMPLGIQPGLRRTFAPVTVFSEATRILLKAIAGTGIRRLVAVKAEQLFRQLHGPPSTWHWVMGTMTRADRNG